MADEITPIVLLQHMQKMQADLQQQIANGIGGLQTQITGLKTEVTNLTQEMRTGFEEARQHRQALQEDLEATMEMASKHQAKLARL